MQFLIFLCLFILVQVQAQEPCQLDIEDIAKAPIFRPLIYNTEGKLKSVNGGKIKIPHGKNVLFSCQENYLKLFPNLNNLTIQCKDDSLWVEHDKSNHKFRDLGCDIRVIEEVKHTLNDCSGENKGVYYQYFDSKQSKYLKLVETCYNYESEQINFIRTILDKNFEDNIKLQHTEKLSSNTDVHHRIELLAAYRADKVAKTIKKLLGDNSMMTNDHLMTVRLLPKILFNLQLQDIEKYPTNIVGMWHSVANGNWKNVIMSIKMLADSRDQPLELILGTSGTTILPNEDTGIPIKLNLIENKAPVPMYVWVIVNDPTKDQAVAVVTINNPFLNPTELKQQTFCESQCDEIPWLKKMTKYGSHERIMFGYTFCCKVRDFKFFPSMRVGGLLKG